MYSGLNVGQKRDNATSPYNVRGSRRICRKVKDSEANLHDKLPDEFKEVLKNKKFLLFKHAIKESQL
jgi:hypothetical protein